MDIYTLRDFITSGNFYFTAHARREQHAARLRSSEVEEAILTGDIIIVESNQRGTKYVVEGRTFLMRQTIRVVCTISLDENGKEQLLIITVYRRTRRGRRWK